jgi:hypothetical protein
MLLDMSPCRMLLSFAKKVRAAYTDRYLLMVGASTLARVSS